MLVPASDIYGQAINKCQQSKIKLNAGIEINFKLHFKNPP